MNTKSFLIHAPGNAIAGGCESLHQLGDAINRLGGDASMCYYPHDQSFIKPDKFSNYNIESSAFNDSFDIVHVFPEIYTKLSQKVSKGTKCIFWLSIDNYYFKKDHFSFYERYKKFYGSLLTGRLPIRSMKDCIHLMQSEYSVLHFSDKDLEKLYVGDYVPCNSEQNANLPKINRILFNPAKGLKITKGLIKDNPDIEFFPLQGYSSEELEEIMCTSSVYIDFGNHPGRDRLPREFVAKGGIVITGKRGSAGNDVDILIPNKYKFDTSDKEFHSKFKLLINEIFSDFSSSQLDMLEYKEVVLADPQTHELNVHKFVEYIESR